MPKKRVLDAPEKLGVPEAKKTRWGYKCLWCGQESDLERDWILTEDAVRCGACGSEEVEPMDILAGVRLMGGPKRTRKGAPPNCAAHTNKEGRGRRTQQKRPKAPEPIVQVDIAKGERPWTAHLFEVGDGTYHKFLAKERKDGMLEVTMVWGIPSTGEGWKTGTFTVSKDEYDRMIEDFAKSVFKRVKHEVFYPQKGFGPEGE